MVVGRALWDGSWKGGTGRRPGNGARLHALAGRRHLLLLDAYGPCHSGPVLAASSTHLTQELVAVIAFSVGAEFVGIPDDVLHHLHTGASTRRRLPRAAWRARGNQAGNKASRQQAEGKARADQTLSRSGAASAFHWSRTAMMGSKSCWASSSSKPSGFSSPSGRDGSNSGGALVSPFLSVMCAQNLLLHALLLSHVFCL